MTIKKYIMTGVESRIISEELTKPPRLLVTSHGFVLVDPTGVVELFSTDGKPDELDI